MSIRPTGQDMNDELTPTPGSTTSASSSTSTGSRAVSVPGSFHNDLDFLRSLDKLSAPVKTEFLLNLSRSFEPKQIYDTPIRNTFKTIEQENRQRAYELTFSATRGNLTYKKFKNLPENVKQQNVLKEMISDKEVWNFLDRDEKIEVTANLYHAFNGDIPKEILKEIPDDIRKEADKKIDVLDTIEANYRKGLEPEERPNVAGRLLGKCLQKVMRTLGGDVEFHDIGIIKEIKFPK